MCFRIEQLDMWLRAKVLSDARSACKSRAVTYLVWLVTTLLLHHPSGMHKAIHRIKDAAGRCANVHFLSR